MIEFVLFNYDSTEDWLNLDAMTARIKKIRLAGYKIIENKCSVDRAKTTLVVRFDNEDDAIFFKLAYL